MNNPMRAILIALPVILFSGVVLADSKDNKRILGSDTNSTVEDVVDDVKRGVFTELEHQIIGKYYGQNRYYGTEEQEPVDSGKKHKKDKKNGKGKQKELPPGLAKRDQLPPGLQKQLERNGTLPPGLAKRDLPEDLAAQLPQVEEGLERVIADTSVVLVDKATGIIRDIIRDIVK